MIAATIAIAATMFAVDLRSPSSGLRRVRHAMISMALALLVLAGCAHSPDRKTVWSEHGLTAAELQWDAAYNEKHRACEEATKPESPEAEACLGDWYDTDAAVADAVRYCVGLLRTYWVARAAGLQPDWAEVAIQIAKAIADLPPPAGEFFNRVRGIK